jgi:hypothetical protein
MFGTFPSKPHLFSREIEVGAAVRRLIEQHGRDDTIID